MSLPIRLSIYILCASAFLSACSTVEVLNSSKPAVIPVSGNSSAACPVTEPGWVLPPEDSAVLNTPAYGYYYVNEDSSIWASAYWPSEEYPLRAGEDGNKIGWFRPAGALMEVTGRRLDGESPVLEAEFPCCYPTRFQASGLYFPTEGCWEVTASAADNVLTFIVKVEPAKK
jgi:hypothetical protein